MKEKNENKSIVWLSYNVHGNESSSSEASLKTAYSLLTKHQDWLKDTIVIIDPCVNPDGRDRYVTFLNKTEVFLTIIIEILENMQNHGIVEEQIITYLI